MLLSDGSVTRHLQLMADLRVQVECLEMCSIGVERAGLPPQAQLIPGPLVQRQVGGSCRLPPPCVVLMWMLCWGRVRGRGTVGDSSSER